MSHKLYMVVSKDDLELPLCVSDRWEDLAKYTGKSVQYLQQQFWKVRTKQKGKSIYKEVVIDDEEEEGEWS